MTYGTPVLKVVLNIILTQINIALFSASYTFIMEIRFLDKKFKTLLTRVVTKKMKREDKF